jgi:hypothetical protein
MYPRCGRWVEEVKIVDEEAGEGYEVIEFRPACPACTAL